jgi:hypothetical protein
MIQPLGYYFVKKGIIEHVIFNKYTIDNGVIKNKKTGEIMSYLKSKAGYNRCIVTDDNGKRRALQVGRAIASTIYGSPPSPVHTADHKDKNRENDIDDNIRWLDESGQKYNQDRPETYKTVYTIIKDGVEKTTDEWVEHLKSEKNHLSREYTTKMIKHYAQRKQHGFSYKEYPDLPGEIWKEIIDSKNKMGYWKISDMNRVKYITKFAENVLSIGRLGLLGGYPTIKINGKQRVCHILAFMTFFPDEYANKRPDEMVLHKDDDSLDFRPYKLRLGTQSENMIDAHNNGKHDGTKSARMKCVSYIDGVYEIMHNSQSDAAKYLRHVGYDNADYRNISNALNPKYTSNLTYDRTWKKCN